MIFFQQFLPPSAERRYLPDDLRPAAAGGGILGESAFRPNRGDFGHRGAQRMAIRGHDLERGMTYGRAEEATPFVRHLDEPASPTPSCALDFRISQVLHDRQRLIARSRSVRQLDAFLVRQDALPEPEIEKIARHVCVAVN